MSDRPRLKDIAQALGVSEMTVSRAFRRPETVSAATRQKIEEMAARLGFVPDRLAGALASARSDLVGVVVPSLSSQVFPEVLNGISAGLAGTRLRPFVAVTGYDLEEEERILRDILAWRPSGIIVAGVEHTDAARALLGSAEGAVVEIMDRADAPVQHCIGIDHLQVGRDMARALFDAGRRRIGFAGTKFPKDFRAAKRRQGFVEGLADLGVQLAAEERYEGGSTVAKGRELVARLLAARPDLDAVYFSSDLLAAGACLHCAQTGIPVPGRLAIAGFNNLELLDGLPLRLATTDSFRFEIGKRAAEIVADPPGDPVVETIATRVLPGASLGP